MKNPAWMALAAATLLALNRQETPFEVMAGYHTGAAIHFRPPESIDWKALAPSDLSSIPIPTSDSALVARLRPLVDPYGDAEVTFPVPLSGVVTTQYHYLVSAAGIDALQLDSIQGTARFGVNRAATTLESIRFLGEIFASVPAWGGSAPDGGGFVLRSSHPLELRASPAAFTADDLLLGSSTVTQTADGGYWARGTSFWDIAAQYRFAVDGTEQEWLFVRWAPDREMIEAGCRYRLALFRFVSAGEPPVQVGSMSYGCDV